MFYSKHTFRLPCKVHCFNNVYDRTGHDSTSVPVFTTDSVFSIPFSLFCRCCTTNPHRVSRRRKKLFRKFTTSSTNKIYTVKAKILTYKLHHFLLAAAGFLCNFLFEFASVCLVVSLLFCYFCAATSL